MPKAFGAPIASLVLIAAFQIPVTAQEKRFDGFWASLGIGVGMLGCDPCDGALFGPSATLALGGTLSDRVLLGVSGHSWWRTESGINLVTVATLLSARYYPRPGNRLFAAAGLGIGVAGRNRTPSVPSEEPEMDPAFPSSSVFSVAAALGLGMDLPLSSGQRVVVFCNGFVVGETGSGPVGVVQLGMGVTFP